MKNFILLFFLIITSYNLNAQIEFEQIQMFPKPFANFDEAKYSSIAFADIDGDSDQDVLITGYNASNQPIAKLYTNNGIGGYTQVSGTPFDGVYDSSIAFADIDGDSDQDVLITGRNSSNQPIAKLYTNDSGGGYTEVSGTPFDGVYNSSIAFADIDGDNDQDVLITGEIIEGIPDAKLYTNNGSGVYSEVAGTPFDWVRYGSIAFADIDGDSDQDVLITGENLGSQHIAKLYTNDGSGGYAEVTGTPFDGVWYSSIAFADIDSDTDQDVLITGSNNSGQRIAKLYTNDGDGVYTEVDGTPFDGVYVSSIAFADINGDSDQDVLITGRNSSDQHIAKLYTNDGSGGYTEINGTSFDGVLFSSIAFADIDGDSDQDVLITGENIGNQPIAKLYTNDNSCGYIEVTETTATGTPFDGVILSSIAFADIDGDSDQDVLITGRNSSDQPIAKLYTNDGCDDYTEVTGTPFDGVQYSSIAFADIDGDSDQDVLITGENNSGQRIAKLYTNDGSGGYTEVSGTPFDGVEYSSIAFADIDGDSDQDVLITGSIASFSSIAKLYTNNGSGNYTEVSGTPFDGVRYSSIAFADIDGDSDQDVLITGEYNTTQSIAKLYSNDGSGGYTEVTGTPFDGVYFSSIAFADIDGDSDQDVLITGYNVNSGQVIAKLYTNDGSGGYTEVTGTPFDGVQFSSIAFADIDGDSDRDVLITGANNNNQRIAKLYRNTSFELNWTGNVNTLWTEAGNWSDNTLPGTTSKAIIADVANQPRIEAADQIEVSDVILRANTSLEVSGVLKVNRDIINNGQINFKSDASSTGQLDEFSGTFSGTGSVTVERFIPASNRAFRLLSTPVTSSGTIFDNWQQGGLNPGDANYEANLGTHITGDENGNNGFDASNTGFASMFGYNNGNYTDILNTDNTSLIAGEAYTIFIRGDRTAANLSASPSGVQETTLRTTGLGTDFRTGQVTLNTSSTPQLSNTNGEYNLIANPYQSIVDLCAIDRTNLSNTVWVRNVASGTNGAWVSLDISNSGLCDTSPPPPTSGSSQFIQPGSAFFTQTTAASPSITFEEADKATDALQPLDIVFNETTMFYVNARLYLSTELQNGDIERDAFGLRFDDQFTTLGSAEDSDKFINPDENIGIVNNGLKYIDKQAMPGIGHHIQLETTGYTASTYSLVFTMANLPENMGVFINDAYLGAQTELTDGFVFDFMVDANIPASIASDRFSLVFDNTTLGVAETTFGYNFSLYPNPNQGKFNIKTPNLSGEVNVEITNLLGQRVYKEQLFIENQSIEVFANNLVEGIYILKLYQDDNTMSQKFIIK
jgi:predicted nucleotidyltransferase